MNKYYMCVRAVGFFRVMKQLTAGERVAITNWQRRVTNGDRHGRSSTPTSAPRYEALTTSNGPSLPKAAHPSRMHYDGAHRTDGASNSSNIPTPYSA